MAKTSSRSSSSSSPRRARKPAQASRPARTFDARPDTLDFRDRMYVPTLVEVPVQRSLAEYRKARVPILDQGTEGACTGYGLATVVHYLMRKRRVIPDRTSISARMLYNMARRYDEWPGERYSGSSARGAMKGWHKHGVCSANHWPGDRQSQNTKLFAERYRDALRRPLGAYFRVNHRDLTAMHAAMSEVGVLYATAAVHGGWDEVGADGAIAWTPDTPPTGGHAFAIVAYDRKGFWIQNSWGKDWGYQGFARVTYDDWLANGSDVWVARLGAPVELRAGESVSRSIGVASQGSRGYVFCDLRPHIISLGNNGALKAGGTYGTDADDVREIFGQISARISAGASGRNKAIKHLLLYAHGGLTAEDSAIQKIADLRPALLDAGVYPLSFIWHTDLWTTIKNILHDGMKRRRPEGFLDSAKDFMLDRLDDALEPIAGAVGGRRVWAEMKQNGVLASQTGGLLLVLEQLKALVKTHPDLSVHLVGHSAGSILLGGLVSANQSTADPVSFKTCSMWAPACTVEFYREHYVPALDGGSLDSFDLYTLTDRAERDDNCANIYHKSLLYLVSNAFEEQRGEPALGGSGGVPLLGMEKFAKRLSKDEQPEVWVLSPNGLKIGEPGASLSASHGGFDDDLATLQSTLARILGVKRAADADFSHHRSEASQRDRREAIMQLTGSV